MVDLSDVIGKAVGGEKGQLLDTLIDNIRRFYDTTMTSEGYAKYRVNDTDVIALALYYLADSINEDEYFEVDNNSLSEAIYHVAKYGYNNYEMR